MIEVSYTLTVQSGLHIGGMKDGVKIGGVDNPVIRMPIMEADGTKSKDMPYIPGSSIKGKIKSLLMSIYGEKNNGNVSFRANSPYLKFFGVRANENEGPGGLIKTRALFRDAYLSKNWQQNADEDLTETKAENSIDYITGEANPRFIERVVKGVQFELEVVLNIFEDDNEKELKDILKEGMEMLEHSYIGGNGSRGYGKIKVSEPQIVELFPSKLSKDGSDLANHGSR